MLHRPVRKELIKSVIVEVASVHFSHCIASKCSPPSTALMLCLPTPPCYLQGTFEDARDPLSLTDIVTCSRCIDGDLTLLAAVLDIPDEEVATIKSKFKAVQGQTYHMLQKWHSSGTHTKQELAEILKGAGFPQAAST